jgi:hypothetical protein
MFNREIVGRFDLGLGRLTGSRFRLAVVAFVLCVCSANALASDPVKWLTNLDQAKQVAAASGKDLLIVFTGSN